MKICQVCGAEADDKAFECPQCGGTVIPHVSGLSLKTNNEPEKKKTGNPMGMSVSTGSGLTDILRADTPEDVEVEDEFYGGSLPVSLSKNNIDEDMSVKKKSKLGSNIVKLVLLFAVAFGIYTLVMNFLNKETRSNNKEDAYNTYIEAITKNDMEAAKDLIPPYEEEDHFMQSPYMIVGNGAAINNSVLKNKEFLSDKQVEDMNTNLKLATGKTVKIEQACVMEVELITSNAKKLTQEMTFVRIRNYWYLDPGNLY